MLFNELFENKKVAEGFADESAAFAKERGGVLRYGPQARKPETAPAAPAAQAVDREALAAELKKLQAVFDPHYQYSDDHSFWSKQHDIAQRIAYIKKQLSITEQGVAEGLGAYDNDKGIKHTRGSLVAKLESLPKGDEEYEWNRIQAIQHLKQGNPLLARYYMAKMKRGEQGVAEGLGKNVVKSIKVGLS